MVWQNDEYLLRDARIHGARGESEKKGFGLTGRFCSSSGTVARSIGGRLES